MTRIFLGSSDQERADHGRHPRATDHVERLLHLSSPFMSITVAPNTVRPIVTPGLTARAPGR